MFEGLTWEGVRRKGRMGRFKQQRLSGDHRVLRTSQFSKRCLLMGPWGLPVLLSHDSRC